MSDAGVRGRWPHRTALPNVTTESLAETAAGTRPNGITVAVGEWRPEGSSAERSVLRHSLDTERCAVDVRL